ncbi:hypothetical protein GGS24DRAFT_451149 [Hypoxylon argillaceum]|nr:hypothetical protein GGS24DRAFT_451149 [Hypoxylon argillaceum]
MNQSFLEYLPEAPLSRRGCEKHDNSMPRVISSSGAAKDAVIIMTAGHDDKAGAGMTVSSAQEVTSTSIISPWKTRFSDSIAPIRESTASPNQNVLPRQGGGSDWAPDARPWSWQWNAIPTVVVTRTAIVTYTQPPPTGDISQSLSPDSMASDTRTGGVNISAAVAAGIGAGAGIGLLGIGIAVLYFWTKCSRRHNNQGSLGQESSSVEITGEIIGPPYLYPASNNKPPFELSTTRQAKEMCAEPKPPEKDASNRSGIVGLDLESPVIREARMFRVDSSSGYWNFGTDNC